LSHEDQEFAAAKRFVQFANEAIKNARAASAHDPLGAARAAVMAAASKYAPGLLRAISAKAGGRRRSSNGSVSPSHLQPAEETMHDIDRTQLEGDFEFGEQEQQMEGFGETEGVFSESEEMQLAAEFME